MLMSVAQRIPIGADAGGGGGFLPPAVGTVTTFPDTVIQADGASVEYTFEHTHTTGSNAAILLCVGVKGRTDAISDAYTLDKVAYGGSAMTKIGESSTRLYAGTLTIIAFVLPSPSSGANDIEFDITSPAGQAIQCVGATAIDLTNYGGVGSGLDSDNSGGQATTATSQSISVPSGQNNSRIFGVSGVRAAANAGSITATTPGYNEHADFGTGGLSSSTDMGFAVHSIIKEAAGVQAYASSWPNAASFGSLGFEIQGAAA